MNGINPKWGFYLGLVILLEQAVAYGGIALTDMFPAFLVPIIIAWSKALATSGSIIQTYLLGVSSRAQGPLADTAISPAAKIASMIAVAVVASMLLASPSHAATKLQLPFDPLGLNKIATGNISKDSIALWNKIVKASVADLTYASKMAASADSPTGDVRKLCWDAIIRMNKKASGFGLLGDDGQPLVRPDPHVFSDIESLAVVMDNLAPQGSLFASCAGAAQLAKSTTLQFVTAILSTTAGLAALPAGF